MNSARELRDEADRMRAVALTVRDSEVLAEIEILIAELELRAREHGNGTADD